MDGSSNSRRHETSKRACCRSTSCAPSCAPSGEERYHHQHPFHLLMHEGRLTPRTTAGLGAEPLLLPEHDPDQGRDHSFARRRIRHFAAPGASASSITMAMRNSEGGIKRWLKLAEATGLDRRPGARRNGNSSRDALRGERISESRAQPHFARSGRFVADRIVFARPDHAAHGQAAPALSVACGRSGLFRGAA